ncbi:MAG: hypothetical protein H6Q90_610 [Deltaproteobacteria bacterium]|nr:hypothetical protein [Deltaproteobacteria bacterium]
MMSSNALRTTAVRVLVTLAVLVTFTGCGKKADTPSAPDCATAVQNALAISKADIKAALPGMDDQAMEKLKAASLTRCEQDKWSAESRTCMATAKTGSEVTQCEAKKTPAQRDSLLKAIQEAVPPAPDSGSGSDAGSAGAAGSGSAGAGSAAKQ